MSIGNVLAIQGNIFERACQVLRDPAEIVESIFWGGFLCLDGLSLRFSLLDLHKQRALSDADPQKVTQIWRAKRDCLLSTVSLTSSSCMTLDWMNRTKIITLGIFGPLAGIVGYGGRGFFSLIHLYETVGNFFEKNVSYRKSQNKDFRKELFNEQICLLMKITLQVLSAAWGIFGMLYICIGEAFLFCAADTAFLAWIILFPVCFALERFFSIKKSNEPEQVKPRENNLDIALQNGIKV